MNERLKEIRKKHQQRYDAVDGQYWGCVCGDERCDIGFVVKALDKAEQETIVALKDLKREYEEHHKEKRQILAEIVGLENYVEKLKKNTP